MGKHLFGSKGSFSSRGRAVPTAPLGQGHGRLLRAGEESPGSLGNMFRGCPPVCAGTAAAGLGAERS